MGWWRGYITVSRIPYELARCFNDTWAAELPWVLQGLRSSPREDNNISPGKTLYGIPSVAKP
jgi:hypothetical protein